MHKDKCGAVEDHLSPCTVAYRRGSQSVMNEGKTVICIGSVLWDIIGRTEHHPGLGGDVGGRITRVPGGVAMIIAMTLARFGLRPVLLTVIGEDGEGRELTAAAEAMGLDTHLIHRRADLATDRYMAIECGDAGLVAAIADAHSLEAAGDAILTPLLDGTLGDIANPYPGLIALDGNLTQDLLAEIAESPAFGLADLRVAPASPGKAQRLSMLLDHPKLTLYLNRGEAQTLCGCDFDTAAQAAEKLQEIGFSSAMVSNSAHTAAIAGPDGLFEADPPPVEVRRITGAGDTLMAAHIAAEAAGAGGQAALEAALDAAADFISKDEGP